MTKKTKDLTASTVSRDVQRRLAGDMQRIEALKCVSVDDMALIPLMSKQMVNCEGCTAHSRPTALLRMARNGSE